MFDLPFALFQSWRGLYTPFFSPVLPVFIFFLRRRFLTFRWQELSMLPLHSCQYSSPSSACRQRSHPALIIPPQLFSSTLLITIPKTSHSPRSILSSKMQLLRQLVSSASLRFIDDAGTSELVKRISPLSCKLWTKENLWNELWRDECKLVCNQGKNKLF